MLNYQGVNWDKYPSVLIKELMDRKYLGTNKIVGLKRKVNQLIEKALILEWTNGGCVAKFIQNRWEKSN